MTSYPGILERRDAQGRPRFRERVSRNGFKFSATLPTLEAELAWRAQALSAADGRAEAPRPPRPNAPTVESPAPPSRAVTVEDAARRLVRAMRDRSVRANKGQPYKPSTVRKYEDDESRSPPNPPSFRAQTEGRVKGLDERVAVVTGAATGIGRGIARVLAAEGARVVIADIDGAAAEATAAELTAQGGDVLAVAADVTDRAAVDAMAAAALETYGRIDILAANAGVYRWDPIAEITDEVWDRIIDTNVKGAFHSIQAVLPAMRASRTGGSCSRRRSPGRWSSRRAWRTTRPRRRR